MMWIKCYILNLTVFIFPELALSQDYKLVWEDNFNSLDPLIWNIENREGVWNKGGNKELQIYQPGNVSIGNEDGKSCLIITAKKEKAKGYSFTSGRINTKGKFSFRYGRLEASLKFSSLEGGLWPAFWTMGYTGKRWPACGEIDVMELGNRT